MECLRWDVPENQAKSPCLVSEGYANPSKSLYVFWKFEYPCETKLLGSMRDPILNHNKHVVVVLGCCVNDNSHTMQPGDHV